MHCVSLAIGLVAIGLVGRVTFFRIYGRGLKTIFHYSGRLAAIFDWCREGVSVQTALESL